MKHTKITKFYNGTKEASPYELKLRFWAYFIDQVVVILKYLICILSGVGFLRRWI